MHFPVRFLALLSAIFRKFANATGFQFLGLLLDSEALPAHECPLLLQVHHVGLVLPLQKVPHHDVEQPRPRVQLLHPQTRHQVLLYVHGLGVVLVEDEGVLGVLAAQEQLPFGVGEVLLGQEVHVFGVVEERLLGQEGVRVVDVVVVDAEPDMRGAVRFGAFSKLENTYEKTKRH